MGTGMGTDEGGETRRLPRRASLLRTRVDKKAKVPQPLALTGRPVHPTRHRRRVLAKA
jgi:hypothetical protein